MSNSSIEKAMETLNKAKREDSKKDLHSTYSSPGRLNLNDSADRNDGAVHDDHICTLSFSDLERQGFLTPDLTNRRIADEYRAIKRPLLKNAFGKGEQDIANGNLIMVVSALPAEGKTFTSLNLAMSIAMEKDHTVMLVDSDIIKPSLTTMLGLGKLSGLTDLLLNPSISISDIIVRTNIPKLNIIPAGSTHTFSTELLASMEMERVANELAARYPDRVVVFDAPPILVTTEAPVLTRLAGQILMVVEAGRTEQVLIKEAIGQLDSDKVIGMVLNKSRGTVGEKYYGTGYGYYGN